MINCDGCPFYPLTEIKDEYGDLILIHVCNFSPDWFVRCVHERLRDFGVAMILRGDDYNAYSSEFSDTEGGVRL